MDSMKDEMKSINKSINLNLVEKLHGRKVLKKTRVYKIKQEYDSLKLGTKERLGSKDLGKGIKWTMMRSSPHR